MNDGSWVSWDLSWVIVLVLLLIGSLILFCWFLSTRCRRNNESAYSDCYVGTTFRRLGSYRYRGSYNNHGNAATRGETETRQSIPIRVPSPVLARTSYSPTSRSPVPARRSPPPVRRSPVQTGWSLEETPITSHPEPSRPLGVEVEPYPPESDARRPYRYPVNVAPYPIGDPTHPMPDGSGAPAGCPPVGFIPTGPTGATPYPPPSNATVTSEMDPPPSYNEAVGQSRVHLRNVSASAPLAEHEDFIR